MWKLEAGVGVWRWLEARLVFQKNFRAHLLHSALIHHPVYPCWPGDCQHLIYPSQLEEVHLLQEGGTSLNGCTDETCAMLYFVGDFAHCTRLSSKCCYLLPTIRRSSSKMSTHCRVCSHQSCQERHNSRALDETLHSYREQSKVSLSSKYGSPTAGASCPLANGGKMVYMHPSCGSEEPPSLPMRNGYSSGVAWESHNAHA